MWNFFARETFSYEIGEKFSDYVGYSVFSLYKGFKKNSGEKVAIFTYNVKTGNSATLENAKTTIKSLRTLKHPSILTYIDSYEDENVIHLVTDPVTPLLTYLEGIRDLESGEMYLKWGLSTICDGVKFLNDHNQRHNNIFHGAVFVDSSGSWKLGEIGYISNDNAPYPQKVVDNLLKYNPSSHLSPSSLDIWGIRILLWEVFNGEVNHLENLTKPRRIPNNLIDHFQELSKRNVNKKEAISNIIEGCSENNVLFNTLDTLQNYHLKDKDVKIRVCKNLVTLLPNIPKDMLLYKVLKLLKQAYDFDADNSAFLVPVVSKIPVLVSGEEFQACVEQFVITLFSSNDRATRLALLMNVEEIINKINKKSINEMFPYVSTGFLDSNPKIRGETVKALVHFAPKLTKRQLNDEALRNLLHIQSKDSEAYIRTNATICLGKIAHCLQPDIRKKVLVSAFLQALRDPYPAVRNSGIQAFAVTHCFFPLEMIARNVLPGLVGLTVDIEPNVRQNAFKTVKILLSKLEKYSESPELKEELEKDVMNQTVENSSSWSGWAFTAITSKFLKPTDTKIKSPEQESPENKYNPDDPSSEQNSSLQNMAKRMRDTLIEDQGNESARVQKGSFDDTRIKKDSINSNKNSQNEKSNKYSEEHPDEDKSDWENDGWGEANEEVLEPARSLPKPKDQLVKKKNPAGPMKLGTRLPK